METSKIEYVGMWNEYDQCIVVNAQHADLPHISVHWYLAGMWEGGHTHVLPGETDEQAALRAYGHKARKEGTFTFRRATLRRDY